MPTIQANLVAAEEATLVLLHYAAEPQVILADPTDSSIILHHAETPQIIVADQASNSVNLVVVSYGGQQGASAPAEPPKSLTIPNPQINDNFALYRTDAATTFTEIIGTIQGTGSPSVTLSILYGLSRSSATTPLVDNVVVNNTTVGQLLTLLNQPIPADNYIVLSITAVNGSVSELNLVFRTGS